MSFGFNAKFMRDPLRFLQQNLIVNQAIEPFMAQSTPYVFTDFTFVKRKIGERKAKAVILGERGRSRRIGVVELTRYSLNQINPVIARRARSHPMRSIYLGYQEGRATSVHLGDNSRVMFNHSLSGCTLAIAKDDQGTDVMHLAANLSDEQKTRLRDEFFGDRHVRLFEEDEYEDAATTHVIGLNTKKHGWRFFAQGYDTAVDYRVSHAVETTPRNADYICYFSVKEIVV
ncbi:MAG: hypothetical protein JKY04_00675 [Sneathiella sp.]|nr:hypothetical protein [Sneathiella sp.]